MSDKIIIASDHAGYDLKAHLIPFLQGKGFDVLDLGTDSAERSERTDFPAFGAKAAQAILDKKGEWGIIICGTGIGISIAANRFKGIRAAPVMTPEHAALVKRHNDANLLGLGGRFLTNQQAEAIVNAFIDAEFEGGRYERRRAQLDEISC